MTDAEFTTFAKRLFVTFPDVWEWLNANSPDPKQTQEVWREILRDYRLDECLLVLESWLTGARPMFKAFERAQIAMLIRQCVQFDREKDAKRRQTYDEAKAYQRTRGKDYKPIAQILPELRPIFEAGAKLKREVMDGKISQEEYDRRKAELLEKVQ